MAIKAYAPFGYEGSICDVDADLRQGIPSVDIVGFSDAGVKELRERIQSAFRNQGFTFPEQRVLISLSPADLKKEGAGFDLPVALAVLQKARESDMPRSQDVNVLVIGELELSGELRPVRGTLAALQTAVGVGIKYAIIPKGCEALPDGIKCVQVDNLNDAFKALCNVDECEVLDDIADTKSFTTDNDTKISFQPVSGDERIDKKNLDQGLVNALAVAMAGRHHLLAYGSPGCGKASALRCATQLAPNLMAEEQKSVNRIWSLAGLTKPDEKIISRPFRMPHQTASIEGVCGGGPNCRPGEISLAHNGILFLDEAEEFRSSVLQMLRVPLETGTITLSRAGRATTYPAKFQLLMAANPCPCGNYGSHDRVCLCSLKSIEQYWKKFSEPLLDRIAIRYNCNEPMGAYRKTLEDLRTMIKWAVEKQLNRQQKYNQELTAEEVNQYIVLTEEARGELDRATVREGYSSREVTNILKVAQTLSDMNLDNSCIASVTESRIKEAIRMHGKHTILGLI